ncbi:hypothetical protein Plhal710r2_c046g0148991 [Plasmopara halstedii]
MGTSVHYAYQLMQFMSVFGGRVLELRRSCWRSICRTFVEQMARCFGSEHTTPASPNQQKFLSTCLLCDPSCQPLVQQLSRDEHECFTRLKKAGTVTEVGGWGSQWDCKNGGDLILEGICCDKTAGATGGGESARLRRAFELFTAFLNACFVFKRDPSCHTPPKFGSQSESYSAFAKRSEKMSFRFT